MSNPVFFHAAAADAMVADEFTLEGSEGHHAADVQRLRVGESLVVTDGSGCRVHASVIALGRGRLTCLVDKVEQDEPPRPAVTVVQALPKGDRGELAVELLTEVGVGRIVPWQAERCVTRWQGDRAAKGRTKWERAAVAAAKQSRRTWWPAVGPLVDTAGVVALLRECDHAWVLHEAAETPLLDLLDAAAPGSAACVLVVGPEGGVSATELTALEDAGAVAARLGPTVLRTSTAGVVGATLALSRGAAWRRRVEG